MSPVPPFRPHPTSVCLTVNLNWRVQLTPSPPPQPAPKTLDLCSRRWQRITINVKKKNPRRVERGRGGGVKEKAVKRVSTQQSQGHAEATCFVAAKIKNKETFILSVCVLQFPFRKVRLFRKHLWCNLVRGRVYGYMCVFMLEKGGWMLRRALKEPPICLQLWLELHNQLPPPAVDQMRQPKRQGNWLNVIVGRPLSNNRGG